MNLSNELTQWMHPMNLPDGCNRWMYPNWNVTQWMFHSINYSQILLKPAHYYLAVKWHLYYKKSFQSIHRAPNWGSTNWDVINRFITSASLAYIHCNINWDYLVKLNWIFECQIRVWTTRLNQITLFSCSNLSRCIYIVLFLRANCRYFLPELAETVNRQPALTRNYSFLVYLHYNNIIS